MSTPEALRLAADLEAPGRMFSCDAVAAELRRQHAEIERLTAERDAIQALLPDELFAGSKDWTHGGLAQRVDCLKTWLADAQAEASVAYLAFEQVTAAPAPHPDTADAERYRWLRDKGCNTWVPFTWQWKMDAERCDAAIDAARTEAHKGE